MRPVIVPTMPTMLATGAFNVALGLVVAGAADPSLADDLRAELVGKALDRYPHFTAVRAVGPDAPVHVAVDLARLPQVAGATCDLYVVRARTAAQWNADDTLVDARAGGPQTVVLDGAGIVENTFAVSGPGALHHDPDPVAIGAGNALGALGVGYDVVLDCNRDGKLDDGDPIDGRGDTPGFWAVHDTSTGGPLDVTTINYSEEFYETQRTYFPSNIRDLPPQPLIVISHGYIPHHYTWYDNIGEHLASYGYIVMAHRNNPGNGLAEGTLVASGVTLSNVDFILGNQATIGGGVLDGKIDSHRIVLIGHSTGGEGVVRAHHRLRTGDVVPEHYTLEDIVLVSSIAPVSFHPRDVVSPIGVNYHMFLGGADTDTSGAPIPFYVQSTSILERADGNRHFIYIHGAGHEDYHTVFDDPLAEGPDLIGKPGVHPVALGYYLPLMELYLRDNPAALDFFTRMDEDFRPAGIAPEVVLATEYRIASPRGAAHATKFVVDDFQTRTETNTSSSGGAVSFSVSEISEVRMEDLDGSFDWDPRQPSNGMTRARFPDDDPRCVTFEWRSSVFYELEIVAAQRDLTDDGFLSFRAAQGTRHPHTLEHDGPYSFTVTLRDGDDRTSSIDFGAFGRITRPYQREGFGVDPGWQVEFSTVRLRLADFMADGADLDLSNVVAIRFEMGPGFGPDKGRLALDDVEIVAGDPSERSVLSLDREGETARLVWSPADAAQKYDAYRGTLPPGGFASRGTGVAVYDHACFEAGDSLRDGARVSADGDVPEPGTAFYYLVAALPPGAFPLGEAGVDLDPAVSGEQRARPVLVPCPATIP